MVSATAQSCPFAFFGGRGNLLTKAESAAAAPSAPMSPEPRSEAAPDHRLIAALTVDGRTSVKRLSKVSGRAPETVTQRLADMRERGAVYFDLDFGPVLLGLRKTFSLWAAVSPRHLAEAGAALATHPEISFAYARTGVTNLYAVAHCADDADVYRYLGGRLDELPGLRSMETAPQMRTLKTMHCHAPV
jgi:DNA-binding Lrp family transcriptional regulator